MFKLHSGHSLPQELVAHDPLDGAEVLVGYWTTLCGLQHRCGVVSGLASESGVSAKIVISMVLGRQPT